MLKTVSLFLTVSLSLLTSLTLRTPDGPQLIRRHERAVPNSYVVVLKDEAAGRVRAQAVRLSRAHGGRLVATYEHALRGFSVQMTEAAAEALARHPAVAYVEEDGVVELAATQTNAPWGLDRIDQRSLPLSNTYTYASTGAGVNAYVIDTGIRTSHEEFEGRASVAFDNVNDGQNGEDCHGHGTHVASIIGGKTFGAAKGAQLYSVRVFNCNHGGSTVAKLIEAIDFVTANFQSPAVAVLSVSAGPSTSLDAAVTNSVAAGVTYVVAAGNGNTDAGTRSPSRVAEALTVGATDNGDARASFSNYGAALDLFAPGVDIPGANIFDDTSTILRSGTSMAAAHAAGAAARYLEGHNSASPAAVHQALVNGATPGKVIGPGAGSPNRLLHVGESPTLSPTKVDSYPSAPNAAQPGETVTYAVTINNSNAADATGVVFADTVDPNTTLVAGSASCPDAVVSGDTLTCNVGTLAAGQSVTVTFQATIDSQYTGGPYVSNQGVVTADGGVTVLTDDPEAFGATNQTLTPVAPPPGIHARDARAPEPATAAAELLYTVTLSQPAPSAVTVNYATASDANGANPATGGTCAAGADYETTSGAVTFDAGQRVQTVAVTVCSDPNLSESDETFLLRLSNAAGGQVIRAEAVGTITAAGPPGAVLISELRTFGPAGAGDDFVEVYNNSDSPLTVSDGTGINDAAHGFGLFRTGATCGGTPALFAVIPNGTVIPPRGHYLIVGPEYGLGGAAAGDLTAPAGVAGNSNVGLFSTADLSNLSTVTRLDAVGFGTNTGGNCDLLREGYTLPAFDAGAAGPAQHSFYRTHCTSPDFGGCGAVSNSPVDRHNNAYDFLLVANAVSFGAAANWRLGAPGPENLSSPRATNLVAALILDGTKAASVAPNRVRNLNDTGPNKTLGTLSFRRRYVNQTGASVTRLRFRIVDLTTFPRANTGVADLRALSSTPVSVSGVMDSATCLASNGSAATPCTVTVQGTTLDDPPAQPDGGAYNSTLTAGTVTLGAPLPSGASVNLQFLLGVEQSGTFRFILSVEALP